MSEVIYMTSMCRCGCGQETGIHPQSITDSGIVRGEPYRFLYTHQNRIKTVSEETREKIREALTGRKASEVTRLKQSSARLGAKSSVERCEKQGLGLRAFYQTVQGKECANRRALKLKSNKPYVTVGGTKVYREGASYENLYGDRAEEIKNRISVTSTVTKSKSIKKHLRGPDNANWRGGPKDERLTLEYQEWRLMVFGRDWFTCRMCNERGKYLEAHHIERFKDNLVLRLAIFNGITLCRECHNKTKGHEKEYEEHFKEIVEEDNRCLS